MDQETQTKQTLKQKQQTQQQKQHTIGASVAEQTPNGYKKGQCSI